MGPKPQGPHILAKNDESLLGGHNFRLSRGDLETKTSFFAALGVPPPFSSSRLIVEAVGKDYTPLFVVPPLPNTPEISA